MSVTGRLLAPVYGQFLNLLDFAAFGQNLCVMTTSALTIPTIETKRLRIEPLSMRHSNGMFEMWRHAAVQEFSGIAEDEHRNEISMPAQTHHDSDRLIGFWLKAALDGWDSG